MFPILTFSPAFPMIFTMKTMFQSGLNGRVPIPPEKRFLIHQQGDNSMNPKASGPECGFRGDILCAGLWPGPWTRRGP